MNQMTPVPQPIGVFQSFIAQQTETMVLREKVMSLSGDTFEIKLASGVPIFRVQGNAFSLSGRKEVFDMANNKLMEVRKEHFHIHTTFAGHDPQDNKFFEVKSSFALFGSKATATFTSRTGKAEVLKMKGNVWDTTAEIIDDSTQAVVATINRKILNAGELLFGQQTYHLTVAPGVDMVLIAMMAICLDEKKNEGGGFL